MGSSISCTTTTTKLSVADMALQAVADHLQAVPLQGHLGLIQTTDFLLPIKKAG
jgi:hypothetical protein